jgi:hypothetical protein
MRRVDIEWTDADGQCQSDTFYTEDTEAEGGFTLSAMKRAIRKEMVHRYGRVSRIRYFPDDSDWEK